MRILLIEDNQRLSRTLKTVLEEDGYIVDAAYDGEEGESFAMSLSYDLVILDLMLPRKDGIQVCRDLRKEGLKTPILMLTARDAIEDRVIGLDSGADDYLVKPFAIIELRARLRALLRRDLPDKSGCLQIADLVLDPSNHQVNRGDTAIELTNREYNLLEYLMRNPKRLVTRENILMHVWNSDYVTGSNIIDVYIRRLRRKIDEPFEVKLLETIRGSGYRINSPTDNQ